MAEFTRYQKFLLGKIVSLFLLLQRDGEKNDRELGEIRSNQISELEKKAQRTGLSRDQIRDYVISQIDDTGGDAT